MAARSGYSELEAGQIEAAVTEDLKAALAKRGVRVEHDGKAGRPDIILEGPDFAVVVEVAKRSGAAAASELPAVLDHRAAVERALEKPTHLLFSCLSTPPRFIEHARKYNAGGEEGKGGLISFLSLDDLCRVLTTLRSAPKSLYGFERWARWFEAWEEMGHDTAALERFQAVVLHEDAELRAEVAGRVEQSKQSEERRLRKDIRGLEDKLRSWGIVGHEAHRALVYIIFVKLYEEKRKAKGKDHRFTKDGFKEYRRGISAKHQVEYRDRTLRHLIEQEIAVDPEVAEAGILQDDEQPEKVYRLPDKIRDGFVENDVLRVLDRYTFRGSLMDALGAVFEALARKAEKDNRIGQFFTPEPIVRFGVDIAEPCPTERVLDPACGTGRFLVMAMERMVTQAGEVPGEEAEAVRKRIRRELLLGTDADSWVSRIARMNMYIHDDGKSNIRHENGLFLADLKIFPGLESNLAHAVDLCLTNPPLGDMNYRAYAADLAEREEITTENWIKERLPLLPGHYKEAKQVAEAETMIARWAEREREAILSGDEKAEKKARRYRSEHEEKRAAALHLLHTNAATHVVSGNTAKGSALFLAAIKNYLNPQSNAKEVEEWRGGRVAIVVDEAILNAPEYAVTRRFIAEHYFIKGVFSFDRDAFWYQARTTAKTSLLYLYLKPDPAVVQREPIFMGHVNKIGFTPTGKPERSDLPAYVKAYKAFEGVVRSSYRGNYFDEGKARAKLSSLELPYTIRLRWAGEVGSEERLDHAFEVARQIRAGLPTKHPKLSDLAEVVVREPEEEPTGIYTFATVDRRTGRVRTKGVEATDYIPAHLRVIRKGDIVVSGINLVDGAVGYARDDVDGAVVSKEYYTLRVREEQEGKVDPRFLALFLRTARARELVAGTVTGTSNRTRVESGGALLAVPLPEFPPFTSQQQIADEVEKAMGLEERAAGGYRSALKQADRLWGQKKDRMTPVPGDLHSLFYPPEPEATEAVDLPFPETDLNPEAQRTIRRMMDEGDDEGGDDFFTLLGQASEPTPD